MANYYGKARTNYFAVKDDDAFLDEMAGLAVTVVRRRELGETLYGFIDQNFDGAGLEWERLNSHGEIVDIDWITILAKHLAEGHVAVIMEVGFEKYRYLNGWALAVNNKGEVTELNLMHIYEQARRLGPHITTVGD